MSYVCVRSNFTLRLITAWDQQGWGKQNTEENKIKFRRRKEILLRAQLVHSSEQELLSLRASHGSCFQHSKFIENRGSVSFQSASLGAQNNYYKIGKKVHLFSSSFVWESDLGFRLTSIGSGDSIWENKISLCILRKLGNVSNYIEHTQNRLIFFIVLP